MLIIRETEKKGPSQCTYFIPTPPANEDHSFFTKYLNGELNKTTFYS